MKMRERDLKRLTTERARRRMLGLRHVGFWLPDTRSQSFLDEARRQCTLIAETEDDAADWFAVSDVTGWTA